VTAPARPATGWVVELLDRGRWVRRCSARDTEAEALEVLGRLQERQPGEQFRVVPVGGAS
jgi:hypothetical protein